MESECVLQLFGFKNPVPTWASDIIDTNTPNLDHMERLSDKPIFGKGYKIFSVRRRISVEFQTTINQRW